MGPEQGPPPRTITRRSFVHGAAALPVLAAAGPTGGVSRGQDDRPPAPRSPGLIVRVKEPENYEFPFPTLDGFQTPTNLFYIRSHFGVVKGVDPRSWRLAVEGRVERPLALTYDELLRMPSRTHHAVLECAGNGRVFLVPKAPGVQWESGGVGNAEWTGVPLAAVLDRAGLKADAAEVILEGADSGEVKEEPKSPGVIPFARSLPLAKARSPEVVLAYKMNGADLTPAHGFPIRAVVSGWYGMASVKWLKRAVVTDRPFRGYFQSLDYTVFERRDGLPTLVPQDELQVKAQIARPARGEVVPAGRAYRVFGAAWTGDGEVAKVEVSADGGKTWDGAKLLDQSVKYAWRLWEYPWTPDGGPESRSLAVRATDSRGRVQPATRDPDRRNVMVNHVLPVEVEVR